MDLQMSESIDEKEQCILRNHKRPQPTCEADMGIARAWRLNQR